MIKINEIYSKFESILPSNIKKEIEKMNANGVKESKYWKVGDYFVEYMNKVDFPDAHFANGNPIFFQIFKITNEWSIIARFMKVRMETSQKENKEYFKISLVNESEKKIVYFIMEVNESNEILPTVMYCPGSLPNPLDLDYPYYDMVSPYFSIKKVCIEKPEVRKELVENFELRYDIDLNKDKVFNAIDFILLKTYEILSK